MVGGFGLMAWLLDLVVCGVCWFSCGGCRSIRLGVCFAVGLGGWQFWFAWGGCCGLLVLLDLVFSWIFVTGVGLV